MRLLLLAVLIFSHPQFAAFSQTPYFKVSGTVIDAETLAPMPYASVYVENTSIGTVTNGNGDFSLNFSSLVPFHLITSYIGYSKKKIFLFPSDTILNIIALSPESTTLKELVITPGDSVADFVKACYQSISSNYPTSPYEFEAFYRESSRNLVNEYYYFGEAEIILQGSGYQYSNEDGRVKIVQSRVNYFTDSIPTHYYGGPFIGSKGDIIKVGKKFLLGNENEYEYFLKKVYLMEDSEIWVIGFIDKKDMGKKGDMYIDRFSRAYIRIELDLNDADKKGKQIVAYTKWQNKWYLNFIHSEVIKKNKRLNETEITTVDLAVTKIKTDSISVIPLLQQLSYGQPFSLIKNNFKEDFWLDATTILPDTILRKQTREFAQQTKWNNTKKSMVNLVSRLSLNLGLQLLQYSVNSSLIGLNVLDAAGQSILINSLKQPHLPLLYKGGISFRINNKAALNYSYSESLSKVNLFRGSYIGFIYSIQLPLHGNPILLRAGLGWNNQIFGQGFSSLPKATGIQFNNQVYDYSKMRIYLGERNSMAMLSLHLEKKLKGMKWFFIGATYQYSLNSSQRFFLRKESGITNKIHTSPVEKSNIAFTTPYNRPKLNSILFEFGLRWNF